MARPSSVLVFVLSTPLACPSTSLALTSLVAVQLLGTERRRARQQEAPWDAGRVTVGTSEAAVGKSLANERFGGPQRGQGLTLRAFLCAEYSTGTNALLQDGVRPRLIQGSQNLLARSVLHMSGESAYRTVAWAGPPPNIPACKAHNASRTISTHVPPTTPQSWHENVAHSVDRDAGECLC